MNPHYFVTECMHVTDMPRCTILLKVLPLYVVTLVCSYGQMLFHVDRCCGVSKLKCVLILTRRFNLCTSMN